MKRLLQPISLIIGATTEIKSGNFSIPPIKHSVGNDEVSLLASSFNSMVEQLARYDQNQKHFISIASHELRSPLQPILGLSDALRVKVSNNSEDREFADAIFSNAKRLQNTIDNVLQATKIERQLANLNKERLDIYELMRHMVKDSQYQIKASRKKIQLLLLDENAKLDRKKEDDDSTVPRIMVNVDRIGLNQVFTNLLNNAIKFTTEGIISVSIREQSDEKSIPMSNRYVVISIRDTGTGIAPEMFPKLFTKFGTEAGRGTGLGLYISKNIIEAHGGKIWAENNSDGKGATFLFSLPINNSEKNQDEPDTNGTETAIS
jgi:two-component system, OmpR family, sensor histidine kinase VicK